MPEPILSPLSVFFLLGVVQAIFLALALFTATTGNYKANRFLASLLLVFSADLLSEFLDASLYGLQLLELMFFINPTDFLYGPLIWLYVRHMTGLSTTIRNIKPAWQFVPFVISAVMVWSGLSIIDDPELFVKHPELLEGNQIQAWMVNPLMAALSLVHIAVYLSLSLYTLRRYTTSIGNTFSYTEGIELKWLSRLLGLLFTVYLLFVFRIAVAPYFDIIKSADVILNMFLVAVIFALGYFGIRQPVVFAKYTQNVDEQISLINDDDSTEKIALVDDPVKYRRSSLSTDDVNQLTATLTDLIEREKSYLDNTLNLPQLAALLKVSPNHLSQVINEHFSLNFFDFVNGYRIEAAKHQLIEMAPGTYTVLGVALDSGFNSKSAFYTCFKKHTGMTPTQFRKENRPSS